MTAVVDGLAIQEAIDDDFDMRRAYAVLEFMLSGRCRNCSSRACPARLSPAADLPPARARRALSVRSRAPCA